MSPAKSLPGKSPSPRTPPPQCQAGEAKVRTGSRERKSARTSEGDGRRSDGGLERVARGMVLRSGSQLCLVSPTSIPSVPVHERIGGLDAVAEDDKPFEKKIRSMDEGVKEEAEVAKKRSFSEEEEAKGLDEAQLSLGSPASIPRVPIHDRMEGLDAAVEYDKLSGIQWMDEGAKDTKKKRKFSKEEKGKGKLVLDGEGKAKAQSSPGHKGKCGMDSEEKEDVTVKQAVMNHRDEDLTGGLNAAAEDDKPSGIQSMDEVVKEEAEVAKKNFSEEEKGKGKLVPDNADAQVYILEGNGELFMVDARGKNKVAVEEKAKAQYSPGHKGKSGMDNKEKEDVLIKQAMMNRRDEDRIRAINLAPKYAIFKENEAGAENDEKNDSDLTDKGEGEGEGEKDDDEDWPGPFSTAMKIIKDREEKLNKKSKVDCNQDKSKVKLSWVPSVSKMRRNRKKLPPTLKSMCLKVICQNSEEIESLEGIPDAIKNILVCMLCTSRRMNTRVLSLLFNGSPTEIFLSDCSWATEQQFENVIGSSNIAELKVLQLDLCGRCLPDYVLRSSLARSPNCLPSLNKISLRGAYRLSDKGLDAIASSAPTLSSINLCECSLITSDGIINLADKLSLLKELYLDDCQDVDAMKILPSLKKLIFLEVLSVAGINTVSDRFVHSLIPVIGANIRELGFARCVKLISSSLKIIGKNCPHLCTIDLRNVSRLDDSAIAHLANGCRAIQTLKLQENNFSDEAVAAYLQASGCSLVELSLNSIEEVSQLTALAISSHCSNLQRLDLSYCRKMTNEGLGLIADSCLSLHILKLFGCTQVTNLFVDGHSNSLVKIIGLKGGWTLDLDEVHH